VPEVVEVAPVVVVPGVSVLGVVLGTWEVGPVVEVPEVVVVPEVVLVPGVWVDVVVVGLVPVVVVGLVPLVVLDQVVVGGGVGGVSFGGSVTVGLQHRISGQFLFFQAISGQSRTSE
jgi:hypothetical protein